MNTIIDVVLPIFAIIAAGYLLGRRGLLGSDSAAALNGFVYYAALPVLLFTVMAQVETSVVLNGPYLAAYAGGQIITMAIGMGIARWVFKTSLSESASHGTAAIYGNVGYMGIPLTLAAFGANALPPAIIATIINGAINISVLATVIEIDQRRGGGTVIKDVTTALFKNPVLMAPILGFLWAATGTPLPAPAVTFGDILGAAAGPCALFSLGLFLVGKPISEGRAEVTSMVTLKLFIHPAVTAILAFWLLADQPLWATICILMAALPTGANLYILTQKYGVYVTRISSSILVSTVLSVLTLSVLFILWNAVP